MYDRLESLIGNIDILKQKTVLIVGIGGVGGYTLETLSRSNIGTIIIIDSDTIDITNLNRQIISTKENIGKSKIEEAKKRVNLISDTNIVTINVFLSKENINILDKYKIDYIVDACDTVDTKMALIKYANEKNIKIISSMGTAKKMHPEKLKIMDIEKTSVDPLAKIIRKKCKEENIKKLKVICSDETPLNIPKLGSNSFVPATAGILASAYIINDIIGDKNVK